MFMPKIWFFTEYRFKFHLIIEKTIMRCRQNFINLLYHTYDAVRQKSPEENSKMKKLDFSLKNEKKNMIITLA